MKYSRKYFTLYNVKNDKIGKKLNFKNDKIVSLEKEENLIRINETYKIIIYAGSIVS